MRPPRPGRPNPATDEVGAPPPLVGNKWLGTSAWSSRWMGSSPVHRQFSVESVASVMSVQSVASVGSFHLDDERGGHDVSCIAMATSELARVVLRRPVAVLVGWLVVFVLSSCCALQFFRVVREAYDPEPDMPSGQSMAEFEKYFPGIMGQVVDSVVFSMVPHAEHWQVDPLVAKASAAVHEVLDTLQESYPDVEVQVNSWRQPERSMGASYISRDRRSWLLQVVWLPNKEGVQPSSRETAAFDFLTAVQALNETYAPQGLDIATTGPDALSLAFQMQARHDVGLHAPMFLPFALLVMHVNLCNCMLLCLPVLCSLVSVVVAFALGFLVATQHAVDATVPTLMAFLCIALSVDWSFFLLARIQEEVAKSATQRDAMVIALTRTGANIALSGFLIVVCSLCLLLMPAAIASMALGGIIAVLTTLACCLTLLPACLVEFPALFHAKPRAAYGATPRAVLAERNHEDTASDGEELGTAEKARQLSSGLWYSWAARVTAYPHNICVLLTVLLAFAPATFKLTQYVPAVNDMYLPRGAPELRTQEKMHLDFEGMEPSSSQLSVLVEANPLCMDGITSNEYFRSSCRVAHDVINAGTSEQPIRPKDLLGVAFYSPGDQLRCIPWRQQFQSTQEAYEALRNHSFSGHFLKTGHTLHFVEIPSDEFIELHQLYVQIWDRTVSSTNGASMMLLQVPWNLRSWEGFRLIESLRQGLPSPPQSSTVTSTYDCHAVRSWELSETSIWYDYVMAALRMLPRSLALASIVTTFLLAVSFGSVVASLKLLLTVVLPMTWVYGLAVACFQDGALDFLGPRTPFHSTGGLHWSVPCSSSMLLLSLALDYNVFYFGRVLEFRRAGLGDAEAVRQGLASTGPVITCAGLIFAIEFSGLLCSEAELNRQGGFVMVAGILLDTFLVRSCLLPAALSIGVSWNWWPMAMPLPILDDDCDPQHEDPAMRGLTNREDSRAESLVSHGV